MSQKSPALRLINDLLADFRDPDFIWQVVALVACLGLAFLVARWWQGRHEEGAGRLSDAGSRLAFPLTGMVLAGLAIATLSGFIHVNLLKLAMPLLGSMALGARRRFRAAPGLPASDLADRVGAHHRRHGLELAGAVHHRSGAIRHRCHGRRGIPCRQATRRFVDHPARCCHHLPDRGFALWIAGVIEAKLMRLHTLDANLRIVGVRVAKAGLTVIAILTSLALVGIDMTALSVFTGALGVASASACRRSPATMSPASSSCSTGRSASATSSRSAPIAAK